MQRTDEPRAGEHIMVEPGILESEKHLGPPLVDMPLKGAELPRWVAVGILLLEFIEDRARGAFRRRRQPGTDIRPDGRKGVLPGAIRAWPGVFGTAAIGPLRAGRCGECGKPFRPCGIRRRAEATGLRAEVGSRTTRGSGQHQSASCTISI